MDFLDLARRRYSVRAYESDPVPEDLLEQVLEAARLAPTASNLQPFQLVVIQTQGREQALRRIYDRDWFVQAPLVICAVATPSAAWKRSDGENYGFVDVAIVVDHLILAATSLGLGTCWIAAFNPDTARKELGLPDEAEPVVFTPLGYPADQPGQKERLALSELVRHERW